MRKEYETLFTPWKIGKLEIKNRIVHCPMGGTSIFGWMEPNHFDKEAANYLLERAKNNVGLILPGISPIKDAMGGKWLYQNKGKFKKLKKFMDEFHETGSKMFVQLTAGFGRSLAISSMMELLTKPVIKTIAKPILDVEYMSAAPSPNPNRWSDKIKTKEMTVKQIKKIVEAFAKTAKLCKEAGVDGIEVHAVHEGYLLDQFTMKYTNQRTDEYGGSFENRYRFAVEIVKAIKRECGKDYPVSLRYSVLSKTKGFRQGALPGEEYVEVGRDMEESEKAAKYLQEAGYDMLNCDNGTYDAWYWAHPPGYMPECCNLEDVAHIKKFVDIPVVCAGRMTIEKSAEAIKNGMIDGAGFARAFLVDPQWVTKLLEGRENDIKPCICCHNACFNFASYKGKPNVQPLSDTMHLARCALNPHTMQSKKYKIVRAKKAKKVAIIGGGIGGMESAIVLKLRGHKPIIYEKTNRLGGVFNEASAPVFKEKDRELLEWYQKQIKELDIKVKFNTEVTNIKELNADEVIIATGAKARNVNIKGKEYAMEALDYLSGKEIGDKVVVIGGGLTGCEIAYDLLLKGKTPVIVEAKVDLIATSGVCLANSSYLREMFAYKKVDVFLESRVEEILKDKVIVIDKDGNRVEIATDDTILSVGYVPMPIAKKSKHVHIVGDAQEVGNLRTVIWRSWDVAMKI